MANKTINTRFQMRRDTAANWTANNPVLLEGELGFETDTRKFKFGTWNGTDSVAYDASGSAEAQASSKKSWSQLDYAGADENQINSLIAAAEDNIKVIVLNEDEADTAACDRAYTVDEVNSVSKGDMCVVKKEFVSGKFSYTAYVYDGSAWTAMDGNYDATNVYLTEDITLAGNYTQVGNLTKTQTGTATFSTAGKSIAEALTEIFSKRLQPADPTQPSVSLSGTQSSQSYEIGSVVSKSGTLSGSLSTGSYTYGPSPTGVAATSWETSVSSTGNYFNNKSATSVSDSASSLAYSYEIPSLSAATTITFYAKANYSAGSVAKDNLGSDSNPVKQIAAGSKEKSATATYTPYRNWFYGYTTNATVITLDKTAADLGLDSSNIRDLTPTNGTAAFPSTISTTNMQQMFFAAPATAVASKSLSVSNNVNGAPCTVAGPLTIAVEGANGYEAINYSVWYVDNASADSGSNTYKIVLA